MKWCKILLKKVSGGLAFKMLLIRSHLVKGNSNERRCQTCAMVHACKHDVSSMERCPPLFWSVVFVIFIAILTHVVCLIDVCFVKSL